ncbi:MAG: J domain-containing protein [Bdellovibrionales bacterium]|nr:J domain-containing protein [Bdellovibrionales bacterium]
MELGFMANDSMVGFYSLLGCVPGDSINTIKRSYRSLAKEYHPDCVRAAGARSELIIEAQNEFRKIDSAYRQILSFLSK